ncbi:nucleotide sugar transporter SLC35B4 isoform X3 [Manis javanica]|uniref:nucleotide sugar transporter SLC35B4 isoform X3 n=1 Tax=Manis javanica TaxID=9974 RepID=UPI0008138DA0
MWSLAGTRTPPRMNGAGLPANYSSWARGFGGAARKHPGCGNIVTFAQFLFIAVEGFLLETDLGRKRPAIPIRYYAVMVTMFFTVSVVNNYALNLNIAMPLHMIFRSGSLIANMILGIIILKKRYSIFKYTSIALVSVGIFICTFMSAKQVTSQSSSSETDGFQAFAWWLLGIAALTFALLMSARMGIFQETLYKQFGKHSKEALFYNHALPLPGFIFLASDIYDHALLFSKSELYQVPVIGVTVPIMWFYLLMNVITHQEPQQKFLPADLSGRLQKTTLTPPPQLTSLNTVKCLWRGEAENIRSGMILNQCISSGWWTCSSVDQLAY